MIICYLKTRPTGASGDPDMASKIYTLKQNIGDAYSVLPPFINLNKQKTERIDTDNQFSLTSLTLF